jgi:hypothetical protein
LGVCGTEQAQEQEQEQAQKFKFLPFFWSHVKKRPLALALALSRASEKGPLALALSSLALTVGPSGAYFVNKPNLGSRFEFSSLFLFFRFLPPFLVGMGDLCPDDRCTQGGRRRVCRRLRRSMPQAQLCGDFE